MQVMIKDVNGYDGIIEVGGCYYIKDFVKTESEILKVSKNEFIILSMGNNEYVKAYVKFYRGAKDIWGSAIEIIGLSTN